MSAYLRRLERLEGATSQTLEAIHILRVIIEPISPGDGAVGVAARRDDNSLAYFIREPSESKEALCERAMLAMGWKE